MLRGPCSWAVFGLYKWHPCAEHSTIQLLPGLCSEAEAQPVLWLALLAQPDLVSQTGDTWVASHHVLCQKSLGLAIFLWRASVLATCDTSLFLLSWGPILFGKSDLLFCFEPSYSTKVHRGAGLWTGSNHPAHCCADRCLSCILAGNGSLLSGSFWNRWNRSR